MSAPTHILIVDDEKTIREPLVQYFSNNAYRVSEAKNAQEARKRIASNGVDLIILDIMMPGEDGLSVCRHVRETCDAAVILLSARDDETDRIVGLEIGADDYVVKPFAPRELLARAKAVLRRAQTLPARHGETSVGSYAFGDWVLDAGSRELTCPSGVAAPLSNGEFTLLATFLRRPRVVLTREQLLDLTRGRDAAPFDRSIDNQVSRLRKKIEDDPKDPKLIKTVWGGGYIFSADVQRI